MEVLAFPKGFSVPDSVRVPVAKGFCPPGKVIVPIAKGFSVPGSTTASLVST